MKELTWRNWTKWMNSNEWIEMNELKRMKWNEWMDMNDLWTSSWKSGPNLSAFDDFYVINYSMTMWSTNEIELSLQFRAHFVDHFPDRGAQPRKQRPSSGDHGQPLYPKKNTGFCARECFQPWIHAFPIAHTSQLLDDDVIDMMMWLTWWLRWWCGCHDGETASHWQSSVTRKFPN